MSMNFIEPEESDVQQAVPVSVVLEKLTVSPENKEWLESLLSKNEIPSEIQPDFEYYIEELVKKSDEAGSNSFRALLLFDNNGILPLLSDCFDKDKLSRERINILPELFTQKQDDKPVVFQAYAVNILDGIRNCAEKDKNFKDAYQKKIQEIRADSSLAQRICYYIKLQNLPKRTYEVGEKPVIPDEISLILRNAEEKYSMRLIAELEEILELPRDSVAILSLPFLLYGKESFTCIRNALFLMILLRSPSKNLDSLKEKIKIPQWDEKNYIHKVFFELARISNDKDFSMRILDKIFEGVNAVDIPYIFFEYIEDHTGLIYGSLLKYDYSDVIEPIRAELEYLDWALTGDTNDPYKIYFDKSRLFLDYIEKLSHSSPKDKLELFQELFSKRRVNSLYPKIDKFWAIREKTIKDILTFIAQEKIHGGWTYPERQKEADDLYEKIVDVIAEGAVKYPVKLFLSEEYQHDVLTNYQNDHELAVFKRYCERLELKNSEDALLITKFWSKRYYCSINFGQPIRPSYNDSSVNKEEFLYENVFLKFINDEDFICCFLSIPRNFDSGSFFAAYYLAHWVLYQNKDKTMSDVFTEASKKLLHDKKITFPDKIAEFIRSYKIPGSYSFLSPYKYEFYESPKKKDDKEAMRFLFYLFAALGGEQYDNILKNLSGAKEHFPLYLIRYNYSHNEIVQEEFLNFLFSLKNTDTDRWGNKNEFYNLELIQEACEMDVLKKQVVLEKVSDYIEKNRISLFKSSKIEGLISYFFIKTEEGKTHEAQTTFITQFCERAVQENEASYTELYLFLKMRSFFRNNINPILKIHTDINNAVIIRCCKMLNNFKKNVEQKEFPEDEYTFLSDYIFPASDFVWERTDNIWKALKPLILAFRASRDILLNEALINNKLHGLLDMITEFFTIEDQEKLKELRYDMANDFAEYLKPAKNERQAEKYTEKERGTEGFDLSYTEPSPYWRYAYIRALGDLGIKTDKRGHYFHKILENVSEKDPSKDVQSAAIKVMKELDSIRKGYSGTNHKKCLFEAFWWLKNAHMLSLGGEVDNKKALELRIKEWRW